jgi:hypothetical protein
MSISVPLTRTRGIGIAIKGIIQTAEDCRRNPRARETPNKESKINEIIALRITHSSFRARTPIRITTRVNLPGRRSIHGFTLIPQLADNLFRPSVSLSLGCLITLSKPFHLDHLLTALRIQRNYLICRYNITTLLK